MTWKLLKLGYVAVILAAAVALAPATAGASASSTASPSTVQRALSPLEFGILARVNTIRRAHGLVPLRVNPQLATAADKHSRDMVTKGFFEHDYPGDSFSSRLDKFYGASSSSFWSAGENLLWSPMALDADRAVALWMASPPHRENILSRRWRDFGVSAVSRTAAPGVYGGADVVVVTTDFGVRG